MATRSGQAPRRRQKGTGAIFWRESDQRWIGTYEAGWTASGGRRRVTVTSALPGDAGRADCKRKLDKKIQQVRRQGTAPSATITVKAWSDTWLEETARRKRPKSHATDRSAVRKWIVPTIGRKRLDALTPADVRTVTKAVRDAGRTSSTMLRTQIVLVQMLKDAITDGGHHVPQAVLLVNRPSRSTSDRDAIAMPDALRILGRAVSQPDGSRWVAALLQAMRQGECLGLTWPSVDFDRGVMDVSWQLQALPFEHGCEPVRSAWECGRKFGGDCPGRRLRTPDGYEFRQLDGALSLVRPKSEKGNRVIPLVPWMASELMKWRDVAPSSDHGLVWPRSDGRPQTSKADAAAWLALQMYAGVASPAGRPYHLHEARHTTATLLLELGVEEDVRMAIMGHSSVAARRVYQHTPLETIREALNEVAAKLELGAGGAELP